MLDGSILIKFLLETRLKSESFEPLVSFSSISGSKVVAKTT